MYDQPEQIRCDPVTTSRGCPAGPPVTSAGLAFASTHLIRAVCPPDRQAMEIPFEAKDPLEYPPSPFGWRQSQTVQTLCHRPRQSGRMFEKGIRPAGLVELISYGPSPLLHHPAFQEPGSVLPHSGSLQILTPLVIFHHYTILLVLPVIPHHCTIFLFLLLLL